ncbi:MAG: AraC family transcriptional regulator [Clostridiales bacterium]|nr:AraC family transcriptional regulator [Clostridiales bacterium]
MEIKDLWQHDFHIGIDYAVRQHYKHGDIYSCRQNPRPQHALLYFLSCEATYETRQGQILHAQPGDLLYLAKHSEYTVRFGAGDPRKHSSLLINFQLFDEKHEEISLDANVLPLPFYPAEEAEKALTRLTDLYYDSAYSPGAMKGVLYQLLADISRRASGQIDSDQTNRLFPAVRWLEKHYHEEISVPKLAEMCRMSESGFRKKFTEEFGLSPVRYRLERRIEQAKRLLQHEALSVSEVAQGVGFNDLNYFCRIFRKITGMSPSEYIKV